MKKKINLLLQMSIVFLLLACTSQSKITYVDNVQQNDNQYKYSFKQDKAKTLLKIGKKDSIFNYHILDTTIRVSRYIRDLDKDFHNLNLQMEKLKDREYFPNCKPDSAWFYSSSKFQGQSCFSYAMEIFCRTNDVNPHPYFDSESLISGKTYLLILETLKLKRKAYSWKEYKRTKDPMPSEALIALKCKGMFTHGIYYKDGLFHSKNGFTKPAIFPDLKSIVKSYKYTDTVLIYKPNNEKLLSFTKPI
ncbi:hypothetical protein [Ancylomarina sp. 16SWW S1-10-2]|uniref:hypothetical protein n=1 Tax=Ancylomarina sp. 16SWW S1-10-2 TaxID=2499681 RepID=UPI0012AE94CA|nr:hypothetical protein [Ancylomarina sp. 16SWW S1-10-2]MRT92250.1 hypothetical protein [Ancylomarina sp. 16SWW S1-10-2]